MKSNALRQQPPVSATHRTQDAQQKPLRSVKPRKNTKAAAPGFWQRLSDHPLTQIFFWARNTPLHLLAVPPDPWSGSATQGREIIRDQFDFYGQNFVARAQQWKPDGAGPDWLTALHSFDWLRDLRAVGGDPARRAARTMVKDWLQHYKRWDALAWRPDIVGARLAAWIGLHDFFLASADDGYRATVFESIQKQSRYLHRVLPGHSKGLKLLTAIKGQIYACLALPHSQARLLQALALLQEELDKQILPDGCHCERNPLAHAQALRQLTDIRGALRCGGLAVPEKLQQAIHAMAPMLRFYQHGDGRLALFNGASESEQGWLEMVLQQAHAPGRAPASAPHGGYERLTQGRSVVLFDTGTPPANGLDTQTHAAPLSFEFSVARERLIVNCGHGGSVAKNLPLTQALRCTAAHSTLVAAKTNAAELRPDGHIGRQPRNIRLHRAQERDAVMAAASHDGYHTNLGLIHSRQLYLGDQGEDLRGQDTLVGTAGHPFHIRFHLHPDVKASLTGGQQSGVLLRTRSGAGWRFKADNMQITLEDSVYVSQIGETPKKSTQIVLSGHSLDREMHAHWTLKREKKTRSNSGEKSLPLLDAAGE